jgi:hypothetical protein
MQERFKLSVHRSCRLALLQRSTWYAKSEAWDQSALRQRIRDIALSRPGFGYLRVLVMLQRESLRASIHAGARVCAWRPTSGCRVGALRRRWTIEGLAGRLQPTPSTQLARQPDPERVRQQQVSSTQRSGQPVVQNCPVSGGTSEVQEKHVLLLRANKISAKAQSSSHSADSQSQTTRPHSMFAFVGEQSNRGVADVASFAAYRTSATRIRVIAIAGRGSIFFLKVRPVDCSATRVQAEHRRCAFPSLLRAPGTAPSTSVGRPVERPRSATRRRCSAPGRWSSH